MESTASKQDERERQLRHARGWLLAVAIITFVANLAAVFVVDMPSGFADAPPELQDEKDAVLIAAFVLFAAFGSMWILSRLYPQICMIAALVVYWGVWGFAVAQDPSVVSPGGMIVRFLFTAALVKGILAARRSVALDKELGRVFE